MAIDIAGMDAAQKLAFAQATGQCKLDGGIISSPVSYFDVAITTGYRKLIFDFALRMDVQDSIAGALSADAGVTFFNNTSSFNSYDCEFAGLHAGTWNAGVEPNSVFYFAGNANPIGATIEGTSIIYPGDATTAPFVRSSAISQFGASLPPSSLSFAMDIIMLTDPTFSGGAMNLMRVLPEGNADVNPPTGTGHIVGGSWSLIGFA